jgi:hypothetical protein
MYIAYCSTWHYALQRRRSPAAFGRGAGAKASVLAEMHLSEVVIIFHCACL